MPAPTTTRFHAVARGPYCYEVRDRDTGYHTTDLFVGDDAKQRAESDAEARNRAEV